MKRKLYAVGLVAAVALSGQAIAQQPSNGEASSVLSCFYECKPGPSVRGIGTWAEVTTLMLVNQQATDDFWADMLFLDGNANIISAADTHLGPEDLDEIHVCRTLEANGVPVPQAGTVEIVLSQGSIFGQPTAVGGYGWVKNLLGKFFVNVDEPFDGRVTGIAKTGCRLVPEEVVTAEEIRLKFEASGAPIITEIVIEDTQESSGIVRP